MPAPNPSPRSRQGTYEELLHTAERLFATHGIDAVSLRQIVLEAGHRNPAAVQYHFGSKAALVEAIVAFRLPSIEQRRFELLEEQRAKAGDDDLRGLVVALVRPLLELDATTTHYVEFLARLRGRRDDLAEVFQAAGSAGSARDVRDAVYGVLRDLPPAVRRNRFSMAVDLALNAIANRNARLAAGDDDGLRDEVFEHDLYDAVVGLLSAPRTLRR